MSDLLLPLRELIGSHGRAIETCPQIELACGDEVTALVLRHLEPLSARAIWRKLRAFAAEHPGVQWWLQPKGPDTVQAAGRGRPAAALRAARVRHHACRSSRPTSPRSIRTSTACWCRARCACWTCSSDERVIDWFCGLGNFTLPLATRAREVLGIEGSEALVARSRENYAPNQRSGRAGRWHRRVRGAQPVRDDAGAAGRATALRERWLVDPPREGAFALAKALADLHQQPELRRRLDAAAAHRLRELQPGDAGARCRAAGAPGGLPLHGGGRGQHVPAHGARGEHGGVRPAD